MKMPMTLRGITIQQYVKDQLRRNSEVERVTETGDPEVFYAIYKNGDIVRIQIQAEAEVVRVGTGKHQD